jgi:WD40 repeat protein
MPSKKIGFWCVIILMICVQASASIGSIHIGSITQSTIMNVPRAGHSATLLTNGQVLIAGGCIVRGCENQLTPTAELYDPKQHTFTLTGNLAVARVGHRAILLDSGEVLILGGWAGDAATATAEFYDGESDTFNYAGEMLEPRDGFTATLLHDGQILITGGYNGAMKRLSSAELFDPATGTSVSIAPMSEPRMAHSASLLPDGRVLLVGGNSGRGKVLSSTEIFDPTTRRFTNVGNLSTARHKHGAVTLDNGDVLIIGGSGAGDFDQQYNTTESFDADTQSFYKTATMQGKRFKISDAITVLDYHSVLIAGSNPRAEIYNVDTDQFIEVGGILGQELSYTTATMLENHQVLIIGGYSDKLQVTDNTWLYTPN